MEGRQTSRRRSRPPRESPETHRLIIRFVDMLPLGGEVLEVAGDSGALAVSLARASRMRITALYSSGAAVDAARRKAEKAGVRIDFQKGNAARMTFPDGCFDFLICSAPLKSFPDPAGVLREMRRVLKPGRRGVILSLRRDVPREQVMKHIDSLKRSAVGRFFALVDFRLQLRRSFTLREFEVLLSQVPFGAVRIDGTPFGVEVWFER